jgi:hypothetical protein
MKRAIYISLLLALLFPIQDAISQSKKESNASTTQLYKADFSSVFPNPERGWHNRRDIDGRGNNDVRNFADVKTAGHTLLHSYLRLDEFKNIDVIPQSYLTDLQNALDTIRAQGLKIILRPTHVWSEKPNIPESRILKHIEQLNAVISKNVDVVSHLEVGYLGKWGEWHSGLYVELGNRADGDVRYRIIERILNTTPNSLPIAMRYPMHIREILEEIPVPTGSKALTQTQKDRVGQHGDCFLFDEHDRGTYTRTNLWFGKQTLEQQKQYAFNMITSFGGNKIMGGETCSPKIERIEDTQKDMAAANWSEININFWKDAIAQWKSRMLPAIGNDPEESEFQRISRKLGYRLRLINATFASSGKAGEHFSFSANLSNDGYASVIRKRPIVLVFDNGINRYNIELKNIDVRTWVSGQITLPEQNLQLPSNMESGKYKLALWLPDAHENLQLRPDYAIRLANTEMWDATKGYNLLSEMITIE